MADAKLERLLNLMAALLYSSTPLSAEHIKQRVTGYPDGDASFRRAFERDKDELRSLGIPLEVVGTDGPSGSVGYRIDRADYELDDLSLDDDELAALRMATSVVHLDGLDDGRGLWQLGGAVARPGDRLDQLGAEVHTPPEVVALYRALRQRIRVRFTYHGEERLVDPLGLTYRSGRWYVEGYDETRGASRVFRTDRIEGPVSEAGPSPASDESARERVGIRPPWTPDESPVEVDIFIEAASAAEDIASLHGAVEIERRPDGRVIRVPLSNWPAFRNYLMEYLDHAVVLAPDELRDDVRDWLGLVIDRTTAVVGEVGASAPVETESNYSARTTAGERVMRILAVLPWVAARPRVTVEETCERFGLTESELLADLRVVFMVGVYPYTPDSLIDVFIEDGRISVELGPYFRRPMRLAHHQALALIVAAQGLMSVTGSEADGPLARAVRKVAGSLTAGEVPAVEVDLGPADEGVLASLRLAVDDASAVRLDYYSSARDSSSSRVVEPWRVFAEDGHWYVRAHCRTAGESRTFRVDRIGAGSVESVGDAEAVRPADIGGQTAVPGQSHRRVRIEASDSMRWVLDGQRTDSVEELGDGRFVATAAVVGEAWLARTLLRLGPDVSVTGADDLVNAGTRAATRMLRAYDGHASKADSEPGSTNPAKGPTTT